MTTTISTTYAAPASSVAFQPPKRGDSLRAATTAAMSPPTETTTMIT